MMNVRERRRVKKCTHQVRGEEERGLLHWKMGLFLVCGVERNGQWRNAWRHPVEVLQSFIALIGKFPGYLVLKPFEQTKGATALARKCEAS